MNRGDFPELMNIMLMKGYVVCEYGYLNFESTMYMYVYLHLPWSVYTGHRESFSTVFQSNPLVIKGEYSADAAYSILVLGREKRKG